MMCFECNLLPERITGGPAGDVAIRQVTVLVEEPKTHLPPIVDEPIACHLQAIRALLSERNPAQRGHFRSRSLTSGLGGGP